MTVSAALSGFRVTPLVRLYTVCQALLGKVEIANSGTLVEQSGLLLRGKELFRYAQAQGRLLIPDKLGLHPLA